MARKKTKAASRRMRRWLSTGAVTCSFIGFLMYLSNVPQPNASEAVNVFNRSSVEAHIKPAAQASTEHYTFYKDLPELKVIAKDVAENLPEHAQQLADTATDALPDTLSDIHVDTNHESITQTPQRPSTLATQKKAPAEKLATHNKEKTKDRLALQTDSFSTLAEADHRRAELLLMGLNAHVEKIQANGLVRYRVLVGPFANRDAPSKTRNALAQNSINAELKALSN